MKPLLTTLLLTSLMLGQAGQPKLECFGDLNGTVEPCRKLMQLGPKQCDSPDDKHMAVAVYDQGGKASCKIWAMPNFRTADVKFMSVSTPELMMTCKPVPGSRKVRGCKLVNGHTLDEVINKFLEAKP